MDTEIPKDLIEHIGLMTNLTREQSSRLIREVIDYFSEPLDQFVIRRHRELQTAGNSNSAIFRQVLDEAQQIRFPVEGLTERKIRRMIYG